MIPCPGVYMIQHKATHRSYVGSSTNVERRCLGHVSQLNYGSHPLQDLQDDWDQDGPDAFFVTLLEPLDANSARLDAAERQWCERLVASGVALYCRQIAGRSRAEIRTTLPGLRTQRQAAALTQEQLATKAGIQRPTVNRLERGKEARVTTIRKLADALGCSPDDLMKEQP